MINTSKAHLKTEGTIDYRECKIFYYTYSMFDLPKEYRVNVNVELHHTQNNYIKSLNVYEVFSKDDDAINYGIEQGKKFIDSSYDLGKVRILKTEPIIKPKSDKELKATKPKADKNKTEKK